MDPEAGAVHTGAATPEICLGFSKEKPEEGEGERVHCAGPSLWNRGVRFYGLGRRPG